MCNQTDLCEKCVCVEDFAGNGVDIPGFWADWSPCDKMTYFGGAWENVPPMPSESQPTDSDCHKWVNSNEE